MSNVTRREPIETEIMEAFLTWNTVDYRPVRVPNHAWRCDGCGLVWDKRHFAETCQDRGHIATWQAGPYGVTHTVNGIPQGHIYYVTRSALRREHTLTYASLLESLV